MIFDGGKYFPYHLTTPKQYDIEKVYLFKYNCQSLNSIGEKICVRNGRLFYFINDGKLDINYK